DKQRKTASCLAAQEQARTLASANLLDSMRLMETRLTEQLDSLRAMEAAVRPLYGMLTKEQKKKADDILKGAPGM
ncbi:Spy/CpxP family protein refolding chaperone, partial [Rhodoblastus sp.]|uniref:Spy/CpxP family protein refolding chaperone n=1 Tax=Rhodoblastus sp. TaxID=1962975 RepID=UPI0035B4AD65